MFYKIIPVVQSKAYRDEEDAYIKENNELITLIRGLLKADMENERNGIIKPDVFTEEERNTILRREIKSQMKEMQTLYWIRITKLMFQGLTKEEAREKIYQDLIDKGNLQGAKVMREFQNTYDPLKTNDQPGTAT